MPQLYRFPWHNPILPYEARVPTLETANAFLGTKTGRPLARHTRMERRGESIAVVYHSTDVVTILAYKDRPEDAADAVYRLSNGGWWTPTTKGRINETSPADVFVEGGVWYLGWNGARPLYATPRGYVVYDAYRVPFRDGMHVDGRGRPVETCDFAQVEARTFKGFGRTGRPIFRWTKLEPIPGAAPKATDDT